MARGKQGKWDRKFLVIPKELRNGAKKDKDVYVALNKDENGNLYIINDKIKYLVSADFIKEDEEYINIKVVGLYEK